MGFFESLIALLALAVLLLQVSRRVGLPYPAMLAFAGIIVAMIPGTPLIRIEPHLALALFIAPVLIDAAYDFPLKAARPLLVPLLIWAVLAVIVTAVVVGWLGTAMLGLPLAAAIAVGAVVAPPDAAAATAVLSSLPVERRIDAVLKGESLFNDATALLMFTTALSIYAGGGLDGKTALTVAIAAPGGLLFGIAMGFVSIRLNRFVENTVGGTILQFVIAFATWLIAERLHLSAVLATVASAMTIAAATGGHDSPRMRVHSFAVWTTAVFLLNVVAFLLMGMQARSIITALDGPELVRAGWFATAIVGCVIAVRLAIAFGYRGWLAWRHRHHGGRAPLSSAETLLLGWAGMRGLVTLATSLALPAGFPHRDTVVLAAFAVIVATVIIQGATLGPLIRWSGIDRTNDTRRERAEARAIMARAALARLAEEDGPAAAELRAVYDKVAREPVDEDARRALHHHHGLSIAAVHAQRRALAKLRDEGTIGADDYLILEEGLDWKELAMLGEDGRRLAES